MKREGEFTPLPGRLVGAEGCTPKRKYHDRAGRLLRQEGDSNFPYHLHNASREKYALLPTAGFPVIAF